VRRVCNVLQREGAVITLRCKITSADYPHPVQCTQSSGAIQFRTTASEKKQFNRGKSKALWPDWSHTHINLDRVLAMIRHDI